MDTQNDGLEKVTPFKYGHFCIYVKFLGCMYLFFGGGPLGFPFWMALFGCSFSPGASSLKVHKGVVERFAYPTIIASNGKGTGWWLNHPSEKY